jgi:hypothetical protein
MNKKNIFLIVLSIITVIYYFPIINLQPGPYDEALVLVGAEKVLKGEIPQRDFDIIYPPGQFYTLAAFFSTFGISVLAERIYDILIKSLTSLSIFFVIRLLSSNLTALIGWAMSLVWITLSASPAIPVYPAVLCINISIYLLLHHIKQNKLYFIIPISLFTVLAALFRHDLGGYVAIVIAFVLILRKITGAQKSWTPLILYIASGILAGLPVIIYFYLNSAIESMFNALILYPLNDFTNNMNLPYPLLSRDTLPFFVFPGILLLGVLAFLIFIKRKADDTAAYGILLISLIGIVFFNQVRIRSDIIHLLPVALTAILLAPILLHTLLRELSLSKWLNRMVWAMFIIVFGITLYKPFIINYPYQSPLWRNYVVEVVNPDIERAKYLKINRHLKNAVAYIKNNTSKDEYIYVGVKNHDKLVINFPIVYFLAERNCATKYYGLDPKLTKAMQEEIINELKERSVRLVVLTTSEYWWFEPNLSSIDSGIDLLDNYIATNFELKETYGLFEIWIKK